MLRKAKLRGDAIMASSAAVDSFRAAISVASAKRIAQKQSQMDIEEKEYIRQCLRMELAANDTAVDCTTAQRGFEKNQQLRIQVAAAEAGSIQYREEVPVLTSTVSTHCVWP